MSTFIQAHSEPLVFTLPEELFLLSIDDSKGKLLTGSKDSLKFGMAGALLASLALHERVKGEEKRLIVIDDAPTGEALLDQTLARIYAEKKPRKINHWIQIFANGKLINQTAEGLEARNIIRIEKKRYLWIIPFELFPQVDASAKFWIKQHLREAILAGHDVTPGMLALLSLLKTCQMLNLVFTRDEEKAAAKKVATLVAGEVFGAAVAETLAEIDAATTAAVVVMLAATNYSS
jgi:hypothetical protein